MDDRASNLNYAMETPTPFDLIEAVRMRRTNLKRLPELQTGNVEELDAHLLDSMESNQNVSPNTANDEADNEEP